MADEQTTQEQGAPETPGGDGGEKFDAAYVAKLRQEAANYRTKLRDAEGKLKDLEPKAKQLDELTEAQKTEQQKLAERLVELETEVARRTTESEAANKRAKLLRIAVKVGADPDVVEMLDLSRLNLDDEEATAATLAKLAPAGRAAGGNAANPQRTGANAKDTDAELRARYFGVRNKSQIFGG